MKKCSVCGKECKQLRRGMCAKHYYHFMKYGECKRTRFDPNEIVEYDDYAEMILYDRQGKEKARALIDLEDIDKVKNTKWCLLSKIGYVCDSDKNYLHRLVMDCPDNKVVDHINHNKLDNRKSNLRICTQSQNMMNKRKQCNNSSGVTGVYLDKKYNKWQARIIYNKQIIHLGYFNTKEEAIEARRQAELEYFGEYKYE